MRKDKLSNRSLKFIERNDPNNLKVKEYIENLSKKYFNIYFYEFVNFRERIAYKVVINNKQLYLYLDKEKVELKLIENDMEIEKFYNDSCWYQGLKFIKLNYLKD